MIVLQHNCNGTAVSTVAALEAAIERGAEVACLQEPYVGRRHTISHPGFQIRWPECPKQVTRVALAIRNDALNRYVFEERTDLAGGPHVQCLDVWETVHRRKVRSTRLINIYNKARVEGGGYTIDHIDWSRLIIGRTILAGDFNARSPAWDPWVSGRRNAGTTERLIERHDLIINNNDHQPTRWGKNCKSIIDLTLSTRQVGALTAWEVDSDLATTSDHEVIIFAWAQLRATAATEERMTAPNWNIDVLYTNKQAMEEAAEHWRTLSEGRLRVDPDATSEEELEAEASWIQNSLKVVLDIHAPGKAACARSKRWWTAEIKEMRRSFAGARRACKGGRTSFEEYRRVRNDYYCHIRKAKRLAWERFLEGVFPTDDQSELASDPERCWRALRYTKPQAPSHTPAIKVSGVDGQPDKIVATAEEKEEIFMAQAFPTQTMIDGEMSFPGSIAEVSAREVREALFAQSVKKAPGVDSIGFKALRLLWRWAEDRVVSLVQGCIRAGYHPCTWKTAKGILLRKQGKPTYTAAKAYRVISLLSCLGKVVEKAIATWITNFCEREDIFHRGQFGCRRGRGTSDAVAQLVAKVEKAWGTKRTALALLLDVKGAFDRVNKTQLLRRMIQVGIAGNIVRWVDSFLSNRRAMLVIDGRTGETRDIQAGLPQGSPVSPVLFILSVSALFQWLEDRHSTLQAISFVDDVGLVIECDELEDGTRQLERIATDTMRWGLDNKVEFEVSKTEVLLFSRRKKVLQAADKAIVSIGEQSFVIKHEATKWLGFWLDPKLSFKTHFENRMASAKGALQRVASLSRSNGGLSINLMRRVVVAAVTSVALYGSEVWWRGQQDRVNKLQLLLNRQARAITGLLRSTPLDFLRVQACLPSARDLLDHRQTRYAVRALGANGDHPTHQLLPANFRVGELYGYESATAQPSSIGWSRPEKTHRLFGSRLAQQIVRHVKYDAEYGFDLLCRHDPPKATPMIRTHDQPRMPLRMLPGHPGQTTIFVETAKDVCFGVGVAWKVRDGWKSKAMPLGKYLTEADAASFLISTVLRDLPAILSRTGNRRVEIVTRSRPALTEIQDLHPWARQTIIDIRRCAKRVEEEGGVVTLTLLTSSASSNGSKIASTLAQRAAKQPPKAMRSASLSYVKQTIREKWKPMATLDKHVKDARKSVASRYLQLKSGHAVTGVHLLRIGKVQDTRCWWCSSSKQTVEHLLLKCRKWRRERATMIRKLRTKNVAISETPDQMNIRILFGDNATVDVLEFIEKTEVGKRLAVESDIADSWDVERLDGGGNEEGEVVDDEGG